MGTIYTIIKQRDNCVDTCRGCVMGSSDSDFEIVATDDRETAISYTTQYLASGLALRDEYLNKDWREYYETEVYVLVNGWNPQVDNSIEGVMPESWAKDHEAIMVEARRRAGDSIEGQKESKRLAVHERQRKEQDETESRERARLAELKAKYEGGNNEPS